jgi:hypothetical protein
MKRSKPSLLNYALMFTSMLGQSKSFAQAGAEYWLPSPVEMDRLFTSISENLALLLLAMLIILVVSVGLWGAIQQHSKELLHTIVTPKAQNLFLKILVQIDEVGSQSESAPVTGYIRTLGLKDANIVIRGKFRKGMKLKMNLSSLPAFPERTAQISGDVVSFQSLGGNPESFLVHVRFQPVDEQIKVPLAQYLVKLTEKGSIALSRT